MEESFPKKLGQQRSLKQNRALHLYFTMISKALNDAGLDMRVTLKPDIQIPWTSQTVKDFLWRPIQKAQLGKESTTELTTGELDTIFDTLNRYLSIEHGISEQFPSIDQLMQSEYGK